MSDELSMFKREINLAEYAASKGFVVDKTKSGRSSIVMQRGSEKIGISVNRRTGDENYHDFGTGRGGTIIDFCQREINRNLGEVRKELRSYLGSPKPVISITRPRPRPTKKEQKQALEKEKANMKPLKNFSFLKSRGIAIDILQDSRFNDKIMTDQYNNICFPHLNEHGLSGFEKKNWKYTGFTANGDKGLWMSNAPNNFNKIVVCESGIDALSYAQIHPDNNAAYVSVAGQISLDQEKLLSDLIERNPEKTIVAAFDNDEAGQKYASELEAICNEKKVSFEIDLPEQQGHDWNDVLNEQKEQNYEMEM